MSGDIIGAECHGFGAVSCVEESSEAGVGVTCWCWVCGLVRNRMEDILWWFTGCVGIPFFELEILWKCETGCEFEEKGKESE